MPCRAACSANPPQPQPISVPACRDAGPVRCRCAGIWRSAPRPAACRNVRQTRHWSRSGPGPATAGRTRCQDHSGRGCCAGCLPGCCGAAGVSASTRRVPAGCLPLWSPVPFRCAAPAAAARWGRECQAGHRGMPRQSRCLPPAAACGRRTVVDVQFGFRLLAWRAEPVCRTVRCGQAKMAVYQLS